MADWRDKLQDATFRDVPFHVERASTEGGRRQVIHEFPKAPKAQVEDMGAGVEWFVVDAFTLGDNWDQDRDRLLAALRSAGPGRLVHPYLGELTVSVGRWRHSEGWDEGRYARITIDFIQADNTVYPQPVADTRGNARAAAEAGIAASRDNFGTRYDVSAQPSFVAEGAVGPVTDIVTSIGGLANTVATVPDTVASLVSDVSRISEAVASLVFAPLELADAIVGLYHSLRNAIESPLAALDALGTLFGWGLPDVPGTTPARNQQRINQDALVQLVRQLAVMEAINAAADAAYVSYDDAVGVRGDLIDAVDSIVESVDDSALYFALTAARAAMAIDLNARGAARPRVVDLTLSETVPALALAYSLYADASRADEIVARNALRDPLFVPAAQPVEVLAA